MPHHISNSSSYDEIESADTSRANSGQSQVVLPSNISSSGFIQAAAENNDINEEAVFQRKPFGPECQPKILCSHSNRKK